MSSVRGSAVGRMAHHAGHYSGVRAGYVDGSHRVGPGPRVGGIRCRRPRVGSHSDADRSARCALGLPCSTPGSRPGQHALARRLLYGEFTF